MTSKEFNAKLANKDYKEFTREYFNDTKNLFEDYKALMDAYDIAIKKYMVVIKNDKAKTEDIFNAVKTIDFCNVQKENIWKIWYSIPSAIEVMKKNG